ncbi:hypothetical protein OIDMADRAFT_164780 [Oidiodendron maius Zn]|uniref:Uncharacterized protein n=1 Tax=Oidiodendron maius (strain Zn) TaxID=913774 RepID=A0A0C3HAW3_OIDMZ|nr:hypothetical protein OIDMADRAFT_164780 [Oidiodendron maius Zn]
MNSSPAVHADELSRRISNLDLTSLRQQSIATSEHGQSYTTEELHHLGPDGEGHNTHAAAYHGIKTPPEVPAPPPSPHNDNSASDGALADVDTNTDGPAKQAAKKKKKKKKGAKSKSKRPVPTGFEEFYADAPVTPHEYQEESYVYSRQTCIQRYRKRRCIDSTRSNILTKYLMLGGVDASATKQFTGGLDRETIENSTAQEIADIQATDFIRSGHGNERFFDPSNPENWVVDFEGIAKGFFSSTAPRRLPSDTEQEIKNICGVIRNFLNYILLHSVCPEYTENVMAARKICDLAEKELGDIRLLHHMLPGEFNRAASTLYGGKSQDPPGDRTWESDTSTEDGIHSSGKYRQRIATAEYVFKTVVSFEGSDEMFKAVSNGKVDVVNTETKFVEVVEIDHADMTSIHKYSSTSPPLGVTESINALGKIHVKPWDGPGYYAEDMTDGEDEGGEYPASQRDAAIETFWLEAYILDRCFVGMKFQVAIQELNIGLKFIREVGGIYCSFHTILPNEKVIENWKEPLPNTRPPPTEDDPDAEENATVAEIERGLRQE